MSEDLAHAGSTPIRATGTARRADAYSTPRATPSTTERPRRPRPGASTGAASRLSFDDGGLSPLTTTTSAKLDDTNISALSRISRAEDEEHDAAMTTRGGGTPARPHDTSSGWSPSALGTSSLGSPGEDDSDATAARSRPRHYRNEAVRLRTLLSACRDDLEEAKRDCGGLAKANEAAQRELQEMTTRWSAAAHALDGQKRQTAEQKLAATSLQGERDELEEKVREAWDRVAALGNELRDSEAARRHVQAQLDAQNARLAEQQQRLVQRQREGGASTVAQVELQALAEAVRVVTSVVGRADGHVREALLATAISSTSAEDADADADAENGTEGSAPPLTLTHAIDNACDAFSEVENHIDAAVRHVALTAAPSRDGTDSTQTAEVNADVVVSRTRHLVEPLAHALRAWTRVVRTLGRDRARLAEQCAIHRRAARTRSRDKSAHDAELDWWRRREGQLEAQLTAEQAVGEAPAARRALAEQLDCLEDWTIIAHKVASVQQRVRDTDAALAAATAQTRELEDKLDARREAGGGGGSGGRPHHRDDGHADADARVETIDRHVHEAALHDVHDALEAVTAAKAALEGDLACVAALKDKALEALVVVTRAYTGLAKESWELVQQRRALAYHALSVGPRQTEAHRTAGGLVSDAHSSGRQQQRGGGGGGGPCARGVHRWRVVVVVVLAAQRLRRLAEARLRESWWPHARLAFDAFPDFTHRLRLPVESRVEVVWTRTAITTTAALSSSSSPSSSSAVAVPGTVRISQDALEALLARWHSPSSCSSSQPVDGEGLGGDEGIPWLLRALQVAVLFAGNRHEARRRPGMTLIDGLQRGLARLSRRQDRLHAAPVVEQLPVLYSPNNYFTPGQPPPPPPPAAVVVAGPPSHHLPRSTPGVGDRGVRGGESFQPPHPVAKSGTETPTARKQLFASGGTTTTTATLSGVTAGRARGPLPTSAASPSIPYPAPQLPRSTAATTRTAAARVSPAEWELAASIQQDRVADAYDISTGSSMGGAHAPGFYSVPGNGFAHEVLGVIDALDRRVSGALQRSARP